MSEDREIHTDKFAPISEGARGTLMDALDIADKEAFAVLEAVARYVMGHPLLANRLVPLPEPK